MLKRISNHHITKKTKKIIHIKLQILLFLLLPMVVFTLLTSKNLIPNIQSFVVLTGSMQPTINPGSMVYVKKQPTYRVDDVVSFINASGQTVTHRIVGVNKEKGFVTKGDANKLNDSAAVSSDKVLGKVVVAMPNVGYVINFLRTTQGFVLFIVMPSILFIFLELWNIKTEIERQVERRVLARLETGVEGYKGTK